MCGFVYTNILFYIYFFLEYVYASRLTFLPATHNSSTTPHLESASLMYRFSASKKFLCFHSRFSSLVNRFLICRSFSLLFLSLMLGRSLSSCLVVNTVKYPFLVRFLFHFRSVNAQLNSLNTWFFPSQFLIASVGFIFTLFHPLALST